MVTFSGRNVRRRCPENDPTIVMLTLSPEEPLIRPTISSFKDSYGIPISSATDRVMLATEEVTRSLVGLGCCFDTTLRHLGHCFVFYYHWIIFATEMPRSTVR